MFPPLGSILVIANDSLLRQTLQLVLRRSGYLAITTDDEMSALRILSSIRINLVLLDLCYIDDEKLEFLQSLKQLESDQEFSVVLMASSDKTLLTDDVDCVLERPAGLDDLLATMNVHCKKGSPLGVLSA